MASEDGVAALDKVLTSLRSAARAAAPEECCGVLLGNGEIISAAIPMINEAIDRRNSFSISASALAAISRRYRPHWDVIGFFHSHPAGGTRPSKRDREHAAAWPGYFHAIVATAAGQPERVALYRVSDTSWDPLPIRISAT